MAQSFLKDKVPPHNLEAEQATLGALLLDWDAVGTVTRLLRPDNFYSLQNQKIFAAILTLFTRGIRGDLITITDELRTTVELDAAGGPGYIASLTDTVATSANIEYYAEIVLENSIKRELIKISNKTISQSHDESIKSRAVLEEAESLIFQLADSKQTYEFKTPKEIIPKTIDIIDKVYHDKNAFVGVQTGLTQLDSMTNGFQKSELSIIGARPSMGKTAMALSMVQHIAIKNKVPTAFFSLEMSDMQLMQRLISAESRVSSEKIRTGLFKLSDFQNIQNAAGLIYDAPLYIVDTPNMKLLDLRALARRLKVKHDIQIIFIDYITLITSENTSIPRHEQIAEISRSLKSLARELDIPVIALSQVRRDSEGKQPTLADLRESGSIEQDADVVMFIHRERMQNVREEDRGAAQETQLIVAKQRNGPTGIVEVMFVPQFTSFENKSRERA